MCNDLEHEQLSSFRLSQNFSGTWLYVLQMLQVEQSRNQELNFSSPQKKSDRQKLQDETC